MKINNKSKVAMNIFHQARRRIALIAGLLGEFADVSSEPKSMIWCESLTQEERIRIELPTMENRLANGLVIFLIVPKLIQVILQLYLEKS